MLAGEIVVFPHPPDHPEQAGERRYIDNRDPPDKID
jgi:hypothetical protein